MFILGDLMAPPPDRIPVMRGRAPWVKGILAGEDAAHLSHPLRMRGRAEATLDRAERAIKELGKGQPFLIVYYGSDGAGGWQPLDRPLRTITTLDRFGLVTWHGTTPMLRMLQVDELMAAMGFRGGYNLDGIGQRRDRIRLLGNGVCPPVMAAIIRSLTSRKRTYNEEADIEFEQAANVHRLKGAADQMILNLAAE
jgi:DNA (cytosine-5)-methyltransferase 1